MAANIEDVYHQHVGRVYAFFYVKTFDRMVAEDLTSQTFMLLVEKLSESETTVRNASTYLSGIMRNAWMLYLRDKYRKASTYIEDIPDFDAYVTESVEEARSIGLETFAQPYIDKLPEKQRAILSLRLLEKRTLKEICEITGKDMNYVRTTQKRGIACLREMLACSNPLGKETS
jgi:RNA polymerase sigma factor (sigma-70 family)